MSLGNTALLDENITVETKNLLCFRDDRCLFAPISEEVRVGSSLEVKGRNGSGKTTLLRALIGLHRQTRGSFSISTSFLYQGHKLGLDESMTPVENLVWFQALNGRKANQSSAFRNIDFVGLAEKADTPCQFLSAGQKKKVSIARWLDSEKKLWLLDEPFTSLDTESSNVLVSIFDKHLVNGGSIVYSNHIDAVYTPSSEVRLEPVELEDLEEC